MEKWFLSAKKANFNEIGKHFNINPVTARIIRNREMIEEKQIQRYLFGNEIDLVDPKLLKDGCVGARILKTSIQENKKIRIIGDYDVDGVTSTYILYQGICRCGGNVDTVIPHRMKDGYGVNENLIEQAYKDGVEVIVTCDNGISALEAIHLAKSYKMTVIVTDHHEIPFTYDEQGGKILKRSEADVIINPKQLDCNYPFKGLCGAGVAFKFVELLYQEFQIPKEEAKEFYTYVAIGTICDVMDLIDENRIFVKLGLAQIKETQDVSLLALIKECKLEPSNISTYHIGFVIGPCMNASGRLDTARKTLELFLTKEPSKASLLAAELVKLNGERKTLTEEFLQQAMEKIEENQWIKDKVMVVFLPDCHESIAGIIAGRIREKYYRPVFVLTRGEEAVKGSGRSIDAYSMYEEMTKVDELFLGYGGHPLAAGCSIEEDKVDLLRIRLNELCTLKEEDLFEKVMIDVPMPMGYVTKELVEEFKILEPFGKGNLKPLFAEREMIIRWIKIVGNNRKIVKLGLGRPNEKEIDAVYFGDHEQFLNDIEKIYGKATREKLFLGQEKNVKMSFTFYPEINEYRGSTSLQMVIKNYN